MIIRSLVSKTLDSEEKIVDKSLAGQAEYVSRVSVFHVKAVKFRKLVL